jgi:ribosome-associated heat shock protein Hsp15
VKIRIDIWLHRARLYKSRTQATGACRDGRVLVNDKFADAGDHVEEGNEVKIRQKGLYRAYRVLEAADINLSKHDAKRMYEEITSPDVLEKFRQVETANKVWRSSSRSGDGARPTKKSRREMDKFRGKR